MKKLFLIFIFLITLAPAEAAMLTICSSGCDASTVQGGINLAAN